jgi:hypothetical protein
MKITIFSNIRRIPQTERSEVSCISHFVRKLCSSSCGNQFIRSDFFFVHSPQYTDVVTSGNRDVYDKVEDINTGINCIEMFSNASAFYTMI